MNVYNGMNSYVVYLFLYFDNCRDHTHLNVIGNSQVMFFSASSCHTEKLNVFSSMGQDFLERHVAGFLVIVAQYFGIY